MKLAKLTLPLMIGAIALGSMSASADDGIKMPGVTLTGSAALTTDYLFRGVSQTSNGAAAQVGMTFAHDSGVYFSLWGSSITAFSATSFQSAGLELDTLLGYSGKAGDMTYDVGVMRYNYPGLSTTNNFTVDKNGKIVDADFNEFYGSVSAMGFKGGLAFASDYFNEAGKFMYAYGEYSAPVGSMNLFAHVGYNKFDDDKMMNQALGTVGTDDTYMDYKVAASTAIQSATVELAYIGSNIDEKDCAGGLCEGRFVLTATKGF